MTDKPRLNMPDGYAFAEFESLESTNLQAKKLAAMGEYGPMVIYTKDQTGGRGRNGRTWLSSKDTLTATILLSSAAPKSNIAQLAFVMAIAAHKTVCDLIEPSKVKTVGLKWPNDLLVQGRKLAGILIETCPVKNHHQSVLAVGIGMNVKSAPTDEDFTAISLSQLGVDVDIELVLTSLVANFVNFFDIWAESTNFAMIRKIWLDHALGLGGKITAKLPNQTIHGIFERLDETGILILRDERNIIHQITAGDVFIGHI